NELVEGSLLGGTCIDTGDDPHLAAAEQEVLQLLADHPETGEAHECAEKIDAIGALDLQRYLTADLKVAATIREQATLSKRDPRSRATLRLCPGRRRRYIEQQSS
ncbi:MAG: hypothetical protein U0527_17795, partial [Candidatus Eisenbacteria bacterium]